MQKLLPISFLPLDLDVESKPVLKKLSNARAALAELNGIAESIPNNVIILNILSLQEAKDSSAIENIVTTHDELYISDSTARKFTSIAAKEVHNYAHSLLEGYKEIKQTNLLTSNQIIKLQALLEENDAGFRKTPETTLKNEQTGEIIYTPPQHPDEIRLLMNNLEDFINNSNTNDLDPLVKMALIHHQFESIHPFYDGNGRTGRIINILYLIKEGLLKLPILYLSRYINQNKNKYYTLLQQTRENGSSDPWILYILDAVEQTALQTADMIRGIKKLMGEHKKTIREQLPIVYSQDLINSLFKHPYTKIEYLKNDIGVTRKTAGKYLDQLCDIHILNKKRIGRDNYYFNGDLISLLVDVKNLKKEQDGLEIRTYHK